MANKDEILAYVRKTPANTNVNVLGTMLGGTGGSSLPEVTSDDNGKVLAVVDGTWDKAENDKGYECIVTQVVLTDESVTTVDQDGFIEGRFTYSEPITADTIIVTFNGTEYECEARGTGNYVEYGAPYDETAGAFDWSTYPFSIASGTSRNLVDTETAGTYNIKISAPGESVELDDCFVKAVREAMKVTVTYTTGNISYPTRTERYAIGETITLPALGGTGTPWWQTEPDKTHYQPGASYTVTGDVTFYAMGTL